MPDLIVTPIYVGALGILFAVLSTLTAMGRGQTNTPLGDGGNPMLALRIRRFGNLAEYCAMALVVMLVLELTGTGKAWLHAYGATLLMLRLLHPFVLFSDQSAPLWMKAGRFIAAAGTAGLLAVAGFALLMRTL